MTAIVTRLPEKEIERILSCVKQYTKDVGDRDISKFFVVSVWYPDIANRLRNAGCPPNGFHVFIKERFSDPEVRQQALEIWTEGDVPIEVVREEGCCFVSIPKQVYMQEYERVQKGKAESQESPRERRIEGYGYSQRRVQVKREEDDEESEEE